MPSATSVMDTAPCAACTYGQRVQRAISAVYRQMGMRGRSVVRVWIGKLEAELTLFQILSFYSTLKYVLQFLQNSHLYP